MGYHAPPEIYILIGTTRLKNISKTISYVKKFSKCPMYDFYAN